MNGGHAVLRQTTIFLIQTSTCSIFYVSWGRVELVHGELYREVKEKLYSGRKDYPATRVDVRIYQNVNFEGLCHDFACKFMHACFTFIIPGLPLFSRSTQYLFDFRFSGMT